MSTETDEVRIKGIRPAHDTDDIPIKQHTPADLQAIGYLMAYFTNDTGVWTKVACDVAGKLIIV